MIKPKDTWFYKKAMVRVLDDVKWSLIFSLLIVPGYFINRSLGVISFGTVLIIFGGACFLIGVWLTFFKSLPRLKWVMSGLTEEELEGLAGEPPEEIQGCYLTDSFFCHPWSLTIIRYEDIERITYLAGAVGIKLYGYDDLHQITMDRETPHEGPGAIALLEQRLELLRPQEETEQ